MNIGALLLRLEFWGSLQHTYIKGPQECYFVIKAGVSTVGPAL